LVFFSSRAVLKTGSLSGGGSSRKMENLEEKLKRIDDFNTKGLITDEERKQMRKNILEI
tara:strand:- start:115 stop:291 length:177 start_codon:yes stop_codon:yes gene_type:complete